MAPIKVYGSAVSYPPVAMVVGFVNGSPNLIDAGAEQTTAYLTKDMVPATAAAMASSSSSLPTSLLMLAVQGGKSISANDAVWTDLADRDCFDSLFGADRK